MWEEIYIRFHIRFYIRFHIQTKYIHNMIMASFSNVRGRMRYVKFFGNIVSLFLKYIVRVPVDQDFVARPGETTATLMFGAVLNKGYTVDSLSASSSSYLEYAAVIGCF